MPSNAVVNLSIDGISSYVSFQELVEEASLDIPENNSDYFIESVSLYDSGEGFGWPGSKMNQTTNETEYGFGEDFLGDQEIIDVSLNLFNLSSENPGDYNLIVNIVYDDILIYETTEQVTILGQELEKTETLIQYPAVIGEKVRWKKIINLSCDSNFSTEIHESAENITIKKEDIEIDSCFYSLEEDSLIVSDTGDNFEIDYYTEAPNISEQETDDLRKSITISSNTSYENITAYTNINEVAYTNESSAIGLYEGVTEISIDSYNDTDEDGFIDTIYWTVDHLSERTYDINIRKAELIESSLASDEWTIKVSLTGTGDLEIESSRSISSDSDEDLEIRQIECDSSTIDYSLEDDIISIEDYNCDGETELELEFNEEVSAEITFRFGTSFSVEGSYEENITTSNSDDEDEEDNEEPTSDLGERQSSEKTLTQDTKQEKTKETPKIIKQEETSEKFDDISNMSLSEKSRFILPAFKTYIEKKKQEIDAYFMDLANSADPEIKKNLAVSINKILNAYSQ